MISRKSLTTMAGLMLMLGVTLTSVAGDGGATKKVDGLEGPATPVGVSDKELTSIQLEKEIPGMGDRRLRARYVTVAPGGVVPIHGHEDRPALIYVLKGTIIEHRSDREDHVKHEAGDLTVEADVAHWWENKGTEPVEIVATDIVRGGGSPGSKSTGKSRGGKLDGPTAPVGEEEKILGSIDLAEQIEGIKDRMLRLRLVTVKAGGVVPVHSHEGRPALFYTLDNEIIEYRSDDLGAVTRRAGDASKAEDGVAHWWKNSSDSDVAILVTDIFKSTGSN